MEKKNLDFIVMNNPQETGAGFGTDTNHIWLMNRKGDVLEFPKENKKSLAAKILSTVFNFKLNEQA